MNLEIYNMTILDLNSIKETLSSDFDDFWSYSILQSELENPNSEYFVAKTDNEIVGFAGIWKSIDDVHITDIVVKKSHRKMHIGSALLQKLIDTAQYQNFKSITLEVNEHNNIAIHLYEKYNFKRIGLRKKYYNNTDDAILMAR